VVELTSVPLASEVAAVVASVDCAVVDSAAVVEAAAVVDASVEAGTVEEASVDDAAAVVDVAFSAWAAKPPALSSATVELGSAEEEDEESESEPELPSVLKVIMLAVPPFGTVTTQNDAPPAPTADSLLSTLPEELGEIEQGSPLQPPSGHSILTPKVGKVLIKDEPVKIGFQPILTKVSPLASVFAPAT
jgi:hypothetical protein